MKRILALIMFVMLAASGAQARGIDPKADSLAV